MSSAHRRHDISDPVWLLLEHHLPGKKGTWGGIGRNNRQFINAVFWILRTGVPWRDLPPDYGTGRTRTGVFVVSVTREFGKVCWNS
jgi:transposase